MSSPTSNPNKREVKRPDPFIIFAVTFSAVLGGGILLNFIISFVLENYTNHGADLDNMYEGIPQLFFVAIVIAAIMTAISRFWDENKPTRREVKKQIEAERNKTETELPKMPWEREGFVPEHEKQKKSDQDN